MLEEYVNFLDGLNIRLNEYFDEQNEYIACSAGCNLCCTTSYYPLSKLEYEYVRVGFDNLKKSSQRLVKINIIKALSARILHVESGSKGNFAHECPFLIDKQCSIYNYRPIICRTHGLISTDEKNPNKKIFPKCGEYGFNYSKIWSKSLIFNDFIESSRQLGFKVEPKAYDIGYEKLKNEKKELEFGMVRMMFDWLLEELPDHKNLIDDLYNGRNIEKYIV